MGKLFGRLTLHSGLTVNSASIPSRAGLITDLEITKEYFKPKDKFSSKEVEDSAEKVQFHASQKMVKQKDGSLITFFRNLEGIVNLFGNCFILIGWGMLNQKAQSDFRKSVWGSLRGLN